MSDDKSAVETTSNPKPFEVRFGDLKPGTDYFASASFDEDGYLLSGRVAAASETARGAEMGKLARATFQRLRRMWGGGQ